jgi:hypothetical protein
MKRSKHGGPRLILSMCVWLIPANNSKSKRIRSVPLNDSAHCTCWRKLERAEVASTCSRIRKTGKPFVTSLSKVWYRIRKKSGFASHYAGSLIPAGIFLPALLVSNNRSLYEVAQQLLGHAKILDHLHEIRQVV